MKIEMYEVVRNAIDELKIYEDVIIVKLEEQIMAKNLYNQFGVHEVYLVNIDKKTYKIEADRVDRDKYKIYSFKVFMDKPHKADKRTFFDYDRNVEFLLSELAEYQIRKYSLDDREIIKYLNRAIAAITNGILYTCNDNVYYLTIDADIDCIGQNDCYVIQNLIKC